MQAMATHALIVSSGKKHARCSYGGTSSAGLLHCMNSLNSDIEHALKHGCAHIVRATLKALISCYEGFHA